MRGVRELLGLYVLFFSTFGLAYPLSHKCNVDIAQRAAFTAFLNSNDEPLVPAQFQNHPALLELAFDPAHQKISRATIWEAFAVLQAEDCGEIIGPVVRGVPEVDFFDGYGHPVDVKAPFTNVDGHWTLDLDKATQSVLDKARKSFPNLWQHVPEKPTIILDVTRLSDKDLKTLRQKIAASSTREERSRIIEVTIGFCP